MHYLNKPLAYTEAEAVVHLIELSAAVSFWAHDFQAVPPTLKPMAYPHQLHE